MEVEEYMVGGPGQLHSAHTARGAGWSAGEVLRPITSARFAPQQFLF